MVEVEGYWEDSAKKIYLQKRSSTKMIHSEDEIGKRRHECNVRKDVVIWEQYFSHQELSLDHAKGQCT